MRVAPEEVKTLERMVKHKTEHIPHGVVGRLLQDRTNLVKAVERAMDEIGVPGGDYPAPAANAYKMLKKALA